MLIMGDSAENILLSLGGGSPGGHWSGLDPLVITVYGNTASGEDNIDDKRETVVHLYVWSVLRPDDNCPGYPCQHLPLCADTRSALWGQSPSPLMFLWY